MVEGGYDLSEFNYSDLEEVFYEGMHREADTGKVVDKAEIGKTYYPNMPKRKTSVKKKPDAFGGRFKKEEVDRSDVIDYLMESGLTNNPVSAEVLIDNMSDAWLETIIEDLAARTKNIIDADRSGAHGPGDQLSKMMGAASHSLNKAKHSARYMKGKV